MEKELDLEKLESVKVRFAKDAFRARAAHCAACNLRMKKIRREMSLSGGLLSISLNVFQCKRCGKEYLGFDEAKKLDKALIVSRAMQSESYRMRKSLSFDGDSYIFRIPAELAKSFGKKPHADMTPLSSRELLIHLSG